jgi:tripartite ATP-independent transporter DctM subunit
MGLGGLGASILFAVAIRVPLSFALLFGALAFVTLGRRIDPIVLPQTMFSGLDSFLLLGVPLFLLSGNIMSRTSLTRRLTTFVACWVGHARGGLLQVAIVTNLFMSGISGSATVDAVTTTTLLIPGMRQAGYKPAFAAALNAAASTLGPLMPTSIILLVYASVASVSAAKLFLAGLLPALTITALLMIYAYLRSRRDGIPTPSRATWRERALATVRATPALAMPLIVIGGIVGGVFTPTEASAVAAFYAVAVGMFGLRELSPMQLLRVLSETAATCGVIMLLIASTNVISWLLIVNGVGAAIQHIFEPIRGTPWLAMLVINLTLLVLGLVLEPIPIIMLVTPLLLPIVKSMGFDPIQFGIVMTFNTTLALIHPPFGLVMFVTAKVANVSIEDFTRSILPLLGVLLIALAVISYVPRLSLFLPSLMR